MKRTLTSVLVALMLGLIVPVQAAVTGQWDFNSSNLVATIGTDLADFDGNGSTLAATTFSTATIAGGTAVVMGFPACANTQGYVVTHGIAPNGGGGYVNQYTLIMDIMYPAASSGVYRGLWQTSTANGNDADLFVGPSNGIGISSTYGGAILADTWHRVAFVFDLAAASQKLSKYIDGNLVGTQDSGFALDGRWALDPTALLFTDESGETAAGFVNSIQIHDVPLSATDIFALGKPTAAGIPTNIPVFTNLVVTVMPANATSTVGMNADCFSATVIGSGSYTYQWCRGGLLIPDKTDAKLRLTNLQASDAGNYTVVVNNGLQSVTSSPPSVLTVNGVPPAFVTGQWDFNESNLVASCGSPLQYFDATVQADTSFGTTTSFFISDIAGQPANVMYFGADCQFLGGYIMTHGIAPNGGGTNVNQYTVIIDLLCPSSSMSLYRALWQTDPSNTNDGDVFFSPGNGLGISQTYQGALTGDEWHRVVLAFDLTKREFGKYIDGVNVLTAAVGAAPLGIHDAQYLSASLDPLAGGGVDLRWSLKPTALLLGDQDGDLQPMFVSSVQIRNGRMTDASIAAMGAPTANKIPGCISATAAGGQVTIRWTGNVLESAPDPTGPWTEISGAAHPHSVASSTGNKFFRVAR